jgi:hypothetical protein
VADLKAVSQSLMHADLKVKDGAYGLFGGEDVTERTGGLNNSDAGANAADQPTLTA